ITFITAAIVLFWLPKDTVAASPQKVRIGAEIRHTLKSYFDPRYANLLLIGVLMFMSYAMCQQTLGYLIQDQLMITPEAAASILAKAFIYSAVFSLIAQIGVVSKLKLPASIVLTLGLPLMMVGYLILLQLSEPLDAMIAFSCIGFGFGMAMPGFAAAASLSVSAEEQGSVAGIISGAPALGYILGPTLGSVLYQWESHAPYIASAVLNAILTLMAFIQLKRAGKSSAGH
ncbi:MAG: MFS transporter, partial [Pseudomonadales bacterium]|nr:MFS transporter [Pseudomonadales bacterium]